MDKTHETPEEIETTATVEEPEIEVAYTEVESEDIMLQEVRWKVKGVESVKSGANVVAEEGLIGSSKIGTENDGGSDKNETQDFGQEPSGTSIYPKEEAFLKPVLLR